MVIPHHDCGPKKEQKKDSRAEVLGFINYRIGMCLWRNLIYFYYNLNFRSGGTIHHLVDGPLIFILGK